MEREIILEIEGQGDKKIKDKNFTKEEIKKLPLTDTVILHPLEQEKLKNSEQDRGLKRKLANFFLYILLGQLAVMNMVFLMNGLGWLSYNQWTLDLYMTGTLAQVFGVVLVMTKNLFPS